MHDITILLVDDEEEFRTGTARVLGRRGFTVETAASGKEAIEHLADHKIDLVVLDLKMAEMDGLGTLQIIREQHGDLPVIILTGHGSFDSAIATINLEIGDFIQKPVDIGYLAARIKKILANQQPITLREKHTSELMVSIKSYQRVRIDQSIREVLEVFKSSFMEPVDDGQLELGHRSILVTDSNDKPITLLRFVDVIEMIEPEFLRASPYSSYFTGMFIAQCKIFGDEILSDYLDYTDMITITETTTLMEASVLMSTHRLINLPVMKGGQMVGILRDKDIFLEIYSIVV
jgi:CheY-like chemotaxis protein